MTNALSVLSAYDANDDFKDMRAKDHILPRAILMQPLSSPVMDGKASAGAIIDSATNTVLVPAREEGKFIVPIMMWLEWIEWNRDRNCDKKDMVKERSTDPSSKLAQRADRWEVYVDNDGKEKPVVTEYYNYIVAVVDDKISDYESLYVLGFARSSHRVGKTLLNRLWKTKILNANGEPVRAPMFLNRIAIKTMVETKGTDKYWVPVLGEASQNPDAHLPLLAQIASDLKARRKQIIERNRTDTHEENFNASGSSAGSAAEEM